MASQKVRQIRPYSGPDKLAVIDGRTREARLLRETRAALIAHVGGKPSATQAALIERATWLSLRVAQLDARIAEGGGAFTEHDSRTYLAWSNTLGRIMALLGLQPVTSRAPTLAEVLAADTEARRQGKPVAA